MYIDFSESFRKWEESYKTKTMLQSFQFGLIHWRHLSVGGREKPGNPNYTNDKTSRRVFQ